MTSASTASSTTSAPAPAPVTLVCPSCGAAAVPGDRFCEACGGDLPASEHLAGPEVTGELATAATPPPVAGERPCAACGAEASQIADGYCGVCGLKQPAARDHVEAAFEGLAAVSDRGRRHHRNEDAFAVQASGDGRMLAVVCDGVSSTVNPDLASQAAADAAIAVLAADVGSAAVIEDVLLAAYDAARSAVAAVDGEPEPPDLGWPSCTFLAGVVRGGAASLATAGDCRVYWLPVEGEPAVVTVDDSWAEETIAAGGLPPEQAYADPRAHTITRWLGRDADAAWQPRLVHFEATGPGRLVFCSDGLWNYARDAADVASASAAAADNAEPLAVARGLVDFANQAGGHDNITVIVVDVKVGVIALDPEKGLSA